MQAQAAELLEGDGTPEHVRTAFARNNVEMGSGSPSSSFCGGSCTLMGQLPTPRRHSQQDASTDADSDGDFLRAVGLTDTSVIKLVTVS